MDADAVIANAKRRLLALAQDPPFRFRQTSRAAAERYMRRMATFEGHTDNEIAAAETALSVRFTAMLRAYFRHMGRSRGSLFKGIDVAELAQLVEFHARAQELMRATSEALRLPADAVVLLFHQGYAFTFLESRGGFDCPVFIYTGGDGAAQQICDSFAAYIDAELAGMEGICRKLHESGGYYVMLLPDGSAVETHPARSSGDRPTDQPFRLGG